LTTKKPLIFIDCFAGKGRFDDGHIGSPIIIAENIKKFLEKDNNFNKNIRGVFIEKKYTCELEKNLKEYKNCKVWKGTFEDNLDEILSLDDSNNLFIYIDPYGIKSLDFNRFKSLQCKKFNTLEMLINFNSFGFLREACRILKYDGMLEDFDSEDDFEIDMANDMDNMNSIACGEYWQNIILNYKSKLIDMHQAEEMFISEYINRIRQIFKYVINVPIKTRTKNIPKYRMIFATNKDDGLILMTDNMNGVWKEMDEKDDYVQISLFDFFPELDSTENISLEEEIISFLQEQDRPIALKALIIYMIERHGISFREKDYKDILRKMENQEISIIRIPEYTKKGRKATSLDYTLYDIKVELKEGVNFNLFSSLSSYI
jgi:three-Cys-motif partner protein